MVAEINRLNDERRKDTRNLSSQLSKLDQNVTKGTTQIIGKLDSMDGAGKKVQQQALEIVSLKVRQYMCTFKSNSDNYLLPPTNFA